MMSKLIKKQNYELSEIVKKPLSDFSTRLNKEKSPFNLISIENKHLAEISKNMQEIDRANNAMGKSYTFFEKTFFTFSEQTPLKNLKQILSNIERKRQAIKENEYKIKMKMIKLAKLQNKLEKTEDKFDRMELELKIAKIEADIADARIYIEGALKEIYHFQEIYNQIIESNKLDNWDEETLEKAEFEYHIKRAFEQAYQNFVWNKNIGGGEAEYFRQMGIDPQQALLEVVTHYQYITKLLAEKAEKGDNTRLPMKYHYEWLDQMVEKYKDAFNDVLERNGIKNAISRDVLYIFTKDDNK